MNAQDFVNSIKYPMLFCRCAGSPGRWKTALLEETNLPFDLGELEGEVDDCGVFEATNLTCGPGLHDWKYRLFGGGVVIRAQIYSDETAWTSAYSDYEATA